jgi:hypothetical protein
MHINSAIPSNCARAFPAIPTLVSKEDYLNGA